MVTKLDEVSFEKLFKNHFKGLTWFAVRYVKDIETAKEIVQDVFINLWEKRSHIDLSKPVKSYLASSVYNKSLNYIRDNKKFDKDILAFETLFPDAGYEQTDRLVTDELEKNIKDAINELPEKCREIFIMSRYENLKYQEIADKLQISIKTVETQMSKALQHMREKLVEYITILLLIIMSN
ncbi:MAG TPA: RNA polymerase sigma-70 factor [Bacteroidales bacterium]|nr:RNA polymerase sigma-70 factor [Bacteroidales bacterium]HPS16997.1 RNA polymerase sigma-70 factor [Bacteroidales bacterium]